MHQIRHIGIMPTWHQIWHVGMHQIWHAGVRQLNLVCMRQINLIGNASDKA
jgi:hypothetical protein